MRDLSWSVRRPLMRGVSWVSRSGTLHRTIDRWYRVLSFSNNDFVLTLTTLPKIKSVVFFYVPLRPKQLLSETFFLKMLR